MNFIEQVCIQANVASTLIEAIVAHGLTKSNSEELLLNNRLEFDKNLYSQKLIALQEGVVIGEYNKPSIKLIKKITGWEVDITPDCFIKQ